MSDSLSKFGNSFQSKVIAGLLNDREFLERVFDIISKDFFESDANQWILVEILDYFKTYKNLPSMTVFKIKVDGIKNDILKTAVVEQLRNIYTKLTDDDLKFVKDQFIEFCRNQKLKSAIINSVDLLKNGQYDQIKHRVDEALKAGAEKSVGHKYVDDIEFRYSEAARSCIKTGWPLIDELMDGGLGRGELGVIVGSAGGGKSWVLCKIGAEAIKQGKTVVHYTMELNESYVALRYDAIFSTVPFQNLKNHKDEIKEKIESYKDKLIVKYFPLKSVSAQSLKIHVDRIRMLGTKVDLVIVDYGDLLKSVEPLHKNSNSYIESGGIYEELRGVAGELQLPMWSASQANRGGAEEDIIQGHNIAESYKKVMIGDFIVSLSRKITDKAKNTARFHIIKNRFGCDGQILPSRFNASNGDIQIFEEKSKEGMSLTSEMKASGDTIKKMLSNKWNESKDILKENSEDSSEDSKDSSEKLITDIGDKKDFKGFD